MKQVLFEAHPKKHEKIEKPKKRRRKNEKLKNMCFLKCDTFFFSKKRRAQRLGDYWCFIENKRKKLHKKVHNGKQEKQEIIKTLSKK